MSVFQEMERYGSQYLAEFGRSITFRGVGYKALIGTNSLSQTFADGGLIYQSSFSIRFFSKLSEYLSNNPPKTGEKITFDGRDYTIVAVTIRKPSPWIDCTMEATDK